MMRSVLALAMLVGCSSEASPARGDRTVDQRSSSLDAAHSVATPTSADSVAVGSPSSELVLALASAASLGAPVASASSSGAASEPPNGPPPPCPPDMVLVGRFCVDAFEAHLKEPSVDGPLVDHPHYARLEPGVRYVAVSAAGKFPQGYISRVESKAACEAAGKRLCTKAEWTRACRGRGNALYSYGQKGERGRCNTGKIHLLSKLFPHPKGGIRYEDHFNSPELNQTPGFLAPSGQYEGCTTELGVHDMIGNLHEWVSDTVDQELVDALEEDHVERRKQPWRDGNGVFMGGFYSTTSEHGPGCTFVTIAHEPTYHDYSTGFRCCRARLTPPEPEKRPKLPRRPAPRPTP